MKALSLTQPWATAICLGIKQWETRSWPTHFRGELCIHASKGFPKWAKEIAVDLANERGISFEDLPLGKIVCVVSLTECRQTDSLIHEIGEIEQQWGDYSPGRYAFKLENLRVLSDPVPAIGHLGFWPVPWDEAVNVSRQRNRLNHGNPNYTP
jgi:activating signal cointegrator 1